ncbi:hypothetical protein [Paenibacillus sp.]
MVGICCRLLLLVLLLCGCGSSRMTERSDTAVSEQTQADIRQLAYHGTQLKLTDFVKKDMTIRFHWVKFDTDKNPDEEGNYPKMGEGSGEVDIHEDGSMEVIQNDSLQVKTEMDSSHEVEAEEHSQSESEREETGVFNDITWLIIAIVILLLVVWLVRRK